MIEDYEDILLLFFAAVALVFITHVLSVSQSETHKAIVAHGCGIFVDIGDGAEFRWNKP